MDYGKYKYEQSVREREARKNQKRTVVKELRMAPRIENHDFEITRRRALEFLGEGDKVKVTVRFRGREQERPEFGRRLLDRLVAEVGDQATVEQAPAQEGRLMTMVLAPSRRQRRPDHNSQESESQPSEPAEAVVPSSVEAPEE
jgi:translation initiation factor IF-3